MQFIIRWGLGIGLGALALRRPLTLITESVLGITNVPAILMALTAVITIVWVLAGVLAWGLQALVRTSASRQAGPDVQGGTQ